MISSMLDMKANGKTLLESFDQAMITLKGATITCLNEAARSLFQGKDTFLSTDQDGIKNTVVNLQKHPANVIEIQTFSGTNENPPMNLRWNVILARDHQPYDPHCLLIAESTQPARSSPCLKHPDLMRHLTTMPEDPENLEGVCNYFQAIIEHMPNNVYWLNRDGVAMGCNRNTLTFLGLSCLEEFVGMTYEEMGRLPNWTPRHAEYSKQQDREVMETGQAKYNVEEPVWYDRHGHPVYYLSSRVPLFNEKKAVIGIVGISVDVTHKKKAELDLLIRKDKSLYQLKREQEDLLSAFPGKVYWKDAQSRYVGANQEWLALVNRHSIEEIAGKTDDVFFGKEQAELLRKNDQYVMESRETIVEEEEVALENGDIRYFIATKMPRYDDTGNVIGIIGNSIDITRSKQLQAEISALKLSEERFKTLSAVGGMIAHELRTPLAAMKATMVVAEKVLPDLLREYESRLSENQINHPIRRDRLEGFKTLIPDMNHYIDYSQSIISTILSTFKQSAAKNSLTITPFSLTECISETLHYYPLTEEQKALIDNRCTEPFRVIGDKNVFMHTIQNLLKNALQSIDKAQKGTITISAQQTELKGGKKVVLIFRDTGSGICEESLTHIFDAFYTTKKKEAMSIGLGLYFCKMALEQMGATIHCDSKLGHYAQFEITLKGGPSN